MILIRANNKKRLWARNMLPNTTAWFYLFPLESIKSYCVQDYTAITEEHNRASNAELQT